MSIVYRAIDQLKPDPANPHRHSTKQIRQHQGFRLQCPDPD
jgi:hypothetical protein